MLLAVIYGLVLTIQLIASQIEIPGGDNGSCQTDGAPQSLQVQSQINYGSDDMEPITPSSPALWIQCTEDWYNDSQQCQCECGDKVGGVVECDDKTLDVHLAVCYCMTHYDKDPNTIVVGACAYKCYHHSKFWDYYHISNYQCNRTAREGQLCGRCQTGYAPPVYSYDLQCVECSSSHNAIAKRWAKYIVIAFLPLTIFFIIVVTLHISATSPSLNAFILVSQLLTAPVISRIYIPVLKEDTHPSFVGYFTLFILSLYGIWNLDFFRTLYNPFCLNPNMNILQVFALDYIIAAYPLFLITVTYVLVKLHDNNFKLIVRLWRPFRRCFIRFRRHWDVKTSLIDAFATFFLLSYVKFFSVSFDLLIPVKLHNAYGQTLNQTYVYYNAKMPYFGEQHLPYAILAITVLVFFTILPILLLCLYPCHCFQKLLNCCRQRCTVLHTFMDSFQGCNKNRTDGSYDRRWFSAVYLITRIAFHVFVANTHEIIHLLLSITFLLIVTAIFTGVVRPYKSHKFNTVDIILTLIFAIVPLISTILCTSRTSHSIIFGKITQMTVIIVAAVLPLVYIVVISLHWIVIGKKVPQRMLHRVWMLLPCTIPCRRRRSEEQLPDRMANPEECAALLQDPMAVD